MQSAGRRASGRLGTRRAHTPLCDDVRLYRGDGQCRRRGGHGDDDNRFRDFTGAIQSVVTSSAQNDSELFEVNLRDDRYLPFERARVISMWRLELPAEIAPFDFEGISAVILQMRYTARVGRAAR